MWKNDLHKKVETEVKTCQEQTINSTLLENGRAKMYFLVSDMYMYM